MGNARDLRRRLRARDADRAATDKRHRKETEKDAEQKARQRREDEAAQLVESREELTAEVRRFLAHVPHCVRCVERGQLVRTRWGLFERAGWVLVDVPRYLTPREWVERVWLLDTGKFLIQGWEHVTSESIYADGEFRNPPAIRKDDERLVIPGRASADRVVALRQALSRLCDRW